MTDKEKVKETEETIEEVEETTEEVEETVAETEESKEKNAEDVFKAELEADFVEETAAKYDGQFAQIMNILSEIKEMVANVGISGPAATGETITTTEERFNAQNEYYDDEELAEELQIND